MVVVDDCSAVQSSYVRQFGSKFEKHGAAASHVILQASQPYVLINGSPHNVPMLDGAGGTPPASRRASSIWRDKSS